MQERRFQETQNAVTLEIVRLAGRTREAYYTALAASQSVRYREEVRAAAEAGADPDGQSSFDRQDAVLALPVGAARRPCRIFQLECMAMRAAMIISVLFVSCAAGHAMDCKDQTQMGLNQCAAVSYEKADEALNKAYKEVLLRLKDRGDAAGLLAKAQKSWLAFRDSECAFSSSGVSGGSIYPMIHAICLETLTRERTKQLRNYLHCEEGDLSCPVPAR